MKKTFLTVLMTVIFLLVGVNCKVAQKQADLPTFHFFTTKDTLNVKIVKFYKNDVFPYTEAIPYALIIGTINKGNSTRMISVLAVRDNNTYKEGQFLKVIAVTDPTTEITLHPLYIVTDTLVGKQRYRRPIGAEYPAIWAEVIK